jgi:hypothetical protein
MLRRLLALGFVGCSCGEMDCGAAVDHDAAGLVDAVQFGERTLLELGHARRLVPRRSSPSARVGQFSPLKTVHAGRCEVSERAGRVADGPQTD